MMHAEKDMPHKSNPKHQAARKKLHSMLTAAKAKEMLHNPPGGRPLSQAQRGYFGLVAGGGKPTRMGR